MVLPRDETIYALSREEALFAWLKFCVEEGKLAATEARRLWNDWNTAPALAAGYFATVGDVQLMHRLVKDLGGVTAKFYVKEYGGKFHIVLTGNPRLRTILTGTKYGVANPKIVNMGLGYFGAMKSIRGGGIVTAILVSSVDVINEILSDDPSMTRLIGTLAVDVAKVAVGTAASMAAVSLLYGAGAVGASLALGPLAVAVIVGVGAGLALDYLDNRFKLKQQLITMLDDVAIDVAHRAEQAREGLIEAGQRLLWWAVDSVIDELGRRFERFVSYQLNRLRWFPVPRL